MPELSDAFSSTSAAELRAPQRISLLISYLQRNFSAALSAVNTESYRRTPSKLGAGLVGQGTPRLDHPTLAAGLVVSESYLRGRRRC
jgi:hypothetical protein